MSNNIQRELFEEYIKDGPDDVVPLYDPLNDCYHWTGIDDLWRCWKAAWGAATSNENAK